MQPYVLPVCWLLLSSMYAVQTSPVREKISINTDLLNKVREGSNDTVGGDGHGRNDRVHNFAWRISITKTSTSPLPTTREPTSTTPLSVDELAKNPDQNALIHTQLTNTLKDKHYRRLWDSLVKQGFKRLITEMRTPGAGKIFIKDNFDGALEGPAGEQLYTKLVNFLDAIGEKGYKLILDMVQDNLPTFSDENTTPTTTTTTTTTQRTTTIRRTTISKKDIEKNSDLFLKVYIQLSITLKHKEYREKWNHIVSTQGFPTLLEEMRKPGAHKRYMKDNGDKAWDGPEGVKLYETVVNFLHTIGLKGFQVLLDSVEKIPLTQQEELGLTPTS